MPPSLVGRAVNAIKGPIDKVYGSGKLVKARIVVYTLSGNSYVIKNPEDKMYVQFNPSEYTIRRGMTLSEKKALGRDQSPNNNQAVSGDQSVLSVSLYFDSYTELLSEQGLVNKSLSSASDLLKSGYNQLTQTVMPEGIFPSFDMNEDISPAPDQKVNKLFNTILGLVKYAAEDHAPPQIGFIWGEHLHFVGTIDSYSVQYTAFDRDGTPVRAKIDMQITGEEMSLSQMQSEYPKESPDRTKQRTLHYGDQLWMMAQAEYGDVTHWKTIAAANGILNPRAISGVVRLKVPSIR